MRYIVNEDIALQSLSLSRGYISAIIVKNFGITQKKMREAIAYIITIHLYYVKKKRFL